MGTITAITVGSVFLGSVIHLGGGLLNHLPFRSTAPGGAAVSGSETIGSFAGMDVELDAGSLTIEKGSEYSVSYEGYPQGKEPQYEVKGNTLVVTQKMGMNWGVKNGFPNNCSVTVTVPEGVSPELDIKLAMGGIEAGDLSFGTVVLDLDMGACKMTGCSMASCNVDADMGACTFTNCSMTNCGMDADMGDITLTNCSFTDGTFSADMGSIDMTGASFVSADCDANMGSIEVSGSFSSLTADCDMGSIKVTTAEGSENASMDLKTDMGKITVNGQSQGSEFKR